MTEGETQGTNPRIGIIVGSTRPGRLGEPVAKWVLDIAQRRSDATFELLDLLEHPLPPLDEPIPPSAGRYAHDHTKAWAGTVGRLDGFVFVTAEYNHSFPASLKNAIDYLYSEWNNKAAGFVSYGSSGGVRAVEHLRLVLAELQVATVRAQVGLLLASDFVNYREFRPTPPREAAVTAMLDQLVAWSDALRPLRHRPPPPG